MLHVDAAAPSAKKVKTIVSTARCLTCIPAHLNPEPKIFHEGIETVLPPALAKIKVNEKEKIIHVGFDSFSQKTFWIEDIADELKIPVTLRKVLNIGGFGGTSTTKMMDIVGFTLSSVDGKTREKMHIEAHVKCGSICSPLDPLDFELESMLHLQDLTLADTVPRKHARIDNWSCC